MSLQIEAANSDAFHEVYDTKILSLLRQGYRLKVNPVVKIYRRKFREVGFKEGATIRIGDRVDVLKGTSALIYEYAYDGTIFKLKDMEVIYSYGGWKCVEI